MVQILNEAPSVRRVRSGVKMDGKIARSREWIDARLIHLREKQNEFYTRIENIKKEIAERELELSTAMTQSELDAHIASKEAAN